MRERAERIALLMTLEQGKPLTEARVEVMAAADTLTGSGRKRGAPIAASCRRGRRTYQSRLERAGRPVAAFAPWNFPLNQIVRKLGAALAAGCSIIVKAPEETPASPAELIRAIIDAGVPSGVVNLVYGVPAQISEHLIPHDVIRKISFTGSTAVGKQLAALAGKHMKRITMELGGQRPPSSSTTQTSIWRSSCSSPRNIATAARSAPRRRAFLVQRKSTNHSWIASSRRRIVESRRWHGAGDTTRSLANPRRIDAMEALIAETIRRAPSSHRRRATWQ